MGWDYKPDLFGQFMVWLRDTSLFAGNRHRQCMSNPADRFLQAPIHLMRRKQVLDVIQHRAGLVVGAELGGALVLELPVGDS